MITIEEDFLETERAVFCSCGARLDLSHTTGVVPLDAVHSLPEYKSFEEDHKGHE